MKPAQVDLGSYSSTAKKVKSLNSQPEANTEISKVCNLIGQLSGSPTLFVSERIALRYFRGLTQTIALSVHPTTVEQNAQIDHD